MSAIVQRPKGTQDIMPSGVNKWHTVEKAARAAAERYGYREIRTPMFEETGLYVRSVGDTSDVVTKEMYTVSSKGDQSYSLRPEGTAGVVRAMLENGAMNDGFPQRVYYIASFFRHEKPQAGRLREFHQFGVEMFGAAGAYADAEVISLAKTMLESCGITETVLNINSIGCAECRKSYYAALREYFSARVDELCPTCRERLEKNPMRILDCKSEVCSEIAKGAPVILDYLCHDCSEHFETLKAALESYGISYEINPRIVRGLDYYTKTVFEFISNDIGAQGTICGGGRYDGLVSELGGQPTAALGFGMGLERLILAMESSGCKFESSPVPELYIAPMGADAQAKASVICQSLKAAGHSAEFDIIGRGLKAQMRYANKTGAMFVVVLGEDEISSGVCKLKNMRTGNETPVSMGALEAELSKLVCEEKAQAEDHGDNV